MRKKIVLTIGAALAVVSLSAAACQVCGGVKKQYLDVSEHTHDRG